MELNDQDRALLYRLFTLYCWRNGFLDFQLDSLQQEITNQISNINVKKICILSSRQIGKSFWTCIYVLNYLLRNPGKIGRIIAPTLDQCHDIVNDNLSRIIEEAPPGLIIRKRSDLRWDFANGSSLRLAGMKRAHVDSARGGNASIIAYEECGFVSADDFVYCVNSVIGPQLTRSKGIEIFVSTPSEDPEHPLHKVIKPQCEEIGSFFKYTIYESPSIDPEMIEEAIKRSGGANTEAFRREYLAEIIRSQSLTIIPSFSLKHIRAIDTEPRFNMILTVDWGGVRDYTAMIVHYYDSFTGLDIIFDEAHYEPNTPTAKIVDGIKVLLSDYKISKIIADVPGQIQVDLREQYGLEISAPLKGDWLASVQYMASRFFHEKIFINPRCTFLIRSCEAGLFNKTKTDFARNETAKIGHCDALAALMYGLRHTEALKIENEPTLFYAGSQVFLNRPNRNDKFIINRNGLSHEVKQFGKYKDVMK